MNKKTINSETEKFLSYNEDEYLNVLKDENKYIEFECFQTIYLFENRLELLKMADGNGLLPINLKKTFELITRTSKEKLVEKVDYYFSNLVERNSFVAICYFYFIHVLNKDKDFFEGYSFGEDKFISFFKMECLFHFDQENIGGLRFIRRHIIETNPNVAGKKDFKQFLDDIKRRKIYWF